MRIHNNRPFIYTWRNRCILKLTYKLKKRNTGVYFIYGETGVGKTTYLHNVFGNSKDVTWYSCEEFIDMFIECIKHGKKTPAPVNNVIIIENMECISGNETFIREVRRILYHWIRHYKVLVVMTSCVEYLYDAFNNISKLVEVKQTKIRRLTLYRYLRQIGFLVTKEEFDMLIKSGNTMSKIQHDIQKIRIQRIADYKKICHKQT